MRIELSKEVDLAYREAVGHILEDREFLSLHQYVHHYSTTRLMHSINVSYLSWRLAARLGGDAGAAARAGLLHDFCPYDFKDKTPTGEPQAFYHPKAAAENSLRKFGISDREAAAILTHMFPFSPMPRHKEAWIISLADKICAVMEVCRISAALSRKGRVILAPTA